MVVVVVSSSRIMGVTLEMLSMFAVARVAAKSKRAVFMVVVVLLTSIYGLM